MSERTLFTVSASKSGSRVKLTVAAQRALDAALSLCGGLAEFGGGHVGDMASEAGKALLALQEAINPAEVPTDK